MMPNKVKVTIGKLNIGRHRKEGIKVNFSISYGHIEAIAYGSLFYF